ncbi:MAG: hypothetical protein QGI68_19730 [Pseudomonadales bacterium]|jgi:hypothetical protein|nr:hypothetical protein [Pseudomonadales bacterium]MDP7146491.1 hypothetical protein [Pseudomonadales bacterium]MDP7358295.1 hypothetical protein [Pseudomonadales bacterium]MDP7597776.1 hypothetical protein [Pseudomonadales bacterium]HJN52338.1 hypothetical protein [Pseudomonadales bacterium]|tara:strand:+ start:1019 stop:1141 length:123 start_codon:yes stop_codon:yes gene_type:complete
MADAVTGILESEAVNKEGHQQHSFEVWGKHKRVDLIALES